MNQKRRIRRPDASKAQRPTCRGRSFAATEEPTGRLPSITETAAAQMLGRTGNLLRVRERKAKARCRPGAGSTGPRSRIETCGKRSPVGVLREPWLRRSRLHALSRAWRRSASVRRQRGARSKPSRSGWRPACPRRDPARRRCRKLRRPYDPSGLRSCGPAVARWSDSSRLPGPPGKHSRAGAPSPSGGGAPRPDVFLVQFVSFADVAGRRGLGKATAGGPGRSRPRASRLPQRR